jgi:alkanesulfonate monooxygenase SsuD/methylene tetrahydromethanopterin reductase-like flavin-dependent oxidoreductase (luciferase family)
VDVDDEAPRFRFGVVTPVLDGQAAWRDQVRRLADQGYGTVLVPDVPGWQPAPSVALATAASLTELRVGTWVYAAPLRPASTLAWEAHSLSEVTGGRFDLGIGTGRPGIEDLLRELGLPVLDPAQRVARIRDAVALLREHDGPDLHTPVVMAVRGPRARALAAEIADMVTFVITPDDQRSDLVRVAQELRAVREIPVALHVSVVGDVVAPFMTGPDTDPAALRAADSLAILPADPGAAAEQVQRCREEIGATYVVIGSNSADTLAPLVARLAGT